MRHFIRLAALCTAFISSASVAQNLVEPADTIFWQGTIYTGDDSQQTAEAVAVKDGMIVFVGSNDEAAQYQGADTQLVALGGSYLYPGFVDAHAHLSSIGEREMMLNLEGISSVKALQAKLKAWADSHGDDAIIYGRGWIETHWPEKRFPTRWDLDQVVSDKPVILRRTDGHATVVNSAALKAAGITSQTKPPFGGDILKNALGEPTGMLIDTAMALADRLLPATNEEVLNARLVTGGEVYAAYGWTGTHNMSVPWQEVPLMENLSDNGDLKIRVYNSIDMGDAQTLFTGGPRASSNDRIQTRAIKMYMDGALGSRGAALIDSYSDADTHGLLMMKPEDALPIMKTGLEKGIQINTHAIGDKGNRMVLDWYENVFSAVPQDSRAIANPRWRIEHAQIINPDDIGRFKSLGVIPSMQPSHAIGDLHFAPARLGDDRLRGAYAWKSLIDSGVIVAGGSDAPVERGDLRIEFYAAVARADLKGFQGDNWHAEEAVSRSEALKMFTLWPAIASFAEDKLGTISVGKRADFTGFAADIMTIDAPEILTAPVTMTVVDGELIYRRP